jgi:glycine/D-amino acid oxidase-like deaminating enzyme
VHSDVVVVGNGLIGQAIVYELCHRDPTVNVTLVGPSSRTGGASAAAGAMLGCFGEVSKLSLASEPGRAKFALAREARKRWPAIIERLNAERTETPPITTVEGTYVILNGRSGSLDSDNFRALERALIAHGEPFERVDDIPGLDPVPDSRPLAAVHMPNEPAVDARTVLARIEASNRQLGAKVVYTTVERLVASSDRVTGVELRDGRDLPCGHVIVSAGAFTSPLLESVLAKHTVQPVLAGSGFAFIAERVLGQGFTSVVRTVNRAGSCGLHVIPLGSGMEYYGASNIIFSEPEFRPHLGLWHFVTQCAMEQLDQMSCYSRVEKTLFGNRPVPLDTFPLLGPTTIEGLQVVTGSYRDGFHCAPLLAEMAVQTMLDGASAFPPIFEPMRAPLSTLSVSESIEEFADQMTDSAFENSTSLSRFIHHSDLTEMYRAKAKHMYKRMEIDRGLDSDIVNYLTLSHKYESDIDAARDYLHAVWSRAGVSP